MFLRTTRLYRSFPLGVNPSLPYEPCTKTQHSQRWKLDRGTFESQKPNGIARYTAANTIHVIDQGRPCRRKLLLRHRLPRTQHTGGRTPAEENILVDHLNNRPDRRPREQLLSHIGGNVYAAVRACIVLARRPDLLI
jgi:hypothetical protein